jgi:Fe-Mn family superoxide dismutase
MRPLPERRRRGMQFGLLSLPFERHALAPHLSARAVGLHYVKHYKSYVRILNRLTAGMSESEMPLEEIVLSAPPGRIFNNAAQAWNHEFFWNSLTPGGGGAPNGDLAMAIERDFGSFDRFKKRFTKAATSLFGSGWVWLVLNDRRLKVMQTVNADTPIRHGQTPILTLDVWEHAYYADYHNARAKFVAAFLNHLINWDFAAGNFANSAKGELAFAEARHYKE